MGGSQTGRHADGPALYGAAAVWPADWRARWDAVRAEAARRFRAPGRVRAAGSAGRSLRSVLAESGLEGVLRRLAKRHGVDEADVARLWSACDGGDARKTTALVTQRLRLVRSLEAAFTAAARTERLRVRAATRDHVRTLAVSAALALAGESKEEALRGFLEAALPKRIG
jgi:hypothetical protein